MHRPNQLPFRRVLVATLCAMRSEFARRREPIRRSIDVLRRNGRQAGRHGRHSEQVGAC